MKLAQLEREKNDINEKLRVTGKRIDHLERAFRKEEAKKLPEDYAHNARADLAAYEKIKERRLLKEAEAKHKENVELKHRLTRLVPFYESFREVLVERRHDEFEKRRRDAERELEKQIALRKKEYRERKAREKREREERERILREEEERAERRRRRRRRGRRRGDRSSRAEGSNERESDRRHWRWRLTGT